MEPQLSLEDKRARLIVEKLFRNDYGEPFIMTYGQIKLFRAIFEKQHPRVQFECYTQYGKSDVVSMAVLLRVTTHPEKFIILGGTKEKAGIIMGKLVKHIFENEYTLAKFEIGKDESIERIKRERSREKVTFRVDEAGNIGEVLVLSADARRKGEDAGDILIGHGGQNLVEDDAALIPDPIHGKALRMLGGHAGKDFLLKITNTFGHNHAYRSSIDPNFKKIVIDWNQGVLEGRITTEYIDEMRSALDPVMFGILYDCVYPPANMVEEGGWMPLLTEEDIVNAQKRAEGLESKGFKRLGVDIAEGTNYNAFVIRQDNKARIHSLTSEKDLMKTADHFVKIIDDEHIIDTNCFYDATGIGAGVGARVKQMLKAVNGVKVGEKPEEKSEAQKRTDPIEFFNLRAEIAWRGATWIRQGGALEPDNRWLQLTRLRYKKNENGKIQLMKKEEMRARGYIGISESTDVPDALFLTFAPAEFRFMTAPQASPLADDPYGAILESSGPRFNENRFGIASPLVDHPLDII
jgi:hypothetical protein